MAKQTTTITIANTDPLIILPLTVTPATAVFWVEIEARVDIFETGISELQYYGLLKFSRRIGNASNYKYIHYGVSKHYGGGTVMTFQIKNPNQNTWTLFYRPNSFIVGKAVVFNIGVDV